MNHNENAPAAVQAFPGSDTILIAPGQCAMCYLAWLNKQEELARALGRPPVTDAEALAHARGQTWEPTAQFHSAGVTVVCLRCLAHVVGCLADNVAQREQAVRAAVFSYNGTNGNGSGSAPGGQTVKPGG